MIIVGMLDAFERKYRANFEPILCQGGLRRERACFLPGTPQTAATRGRIRPWSRIIRQDCRVRRVCWGGRRQERASIGPGTPHTAATRGHIRPWI